MPGKSCHPHEGVQWSILRQVIAVQLQATRAKRSRDRTKKARYRREIDPSIAKLLGQMY